jgi:hypothetical protein
MYNNNIEVEKVSQRKISALLNSNLTAPDVSNPVYTMTRNWSSCISDNNLNEYYNSVPKISKRSSVDLHKSLLVNQSLIQMHFIKTLSYH